VKRSTTGGAMPEDGRLPCYGYGQWFQTADPMAVAGDLAPEEALKAVGFERQFVMRGYHESFGLETWYRREEPHWFIWVQDDSWFHGVLAVEVHDMMDLLAKWAPVVQSARLDALLEDMTEEGGLIENVMRRVLSHL
jgi:hypothetical protein